jgi:hypothetical protein
VVRTPPLITQPRQTSHKVADLTKLPQGEGGKMGKVIKAVLSAEDKAAIRKGKASLAASRAARYKAEADSRKSK